jgi:hypothetical protein
VIQIGPKNEWKKIIDETRNSDETETDSIPDVVSIIQFERNIANLISNPDYLSPSQIEEEKRELEGRAKDLEAKIKISGEIERRINQLRLESEAERQVKDLGLDTETENLKQRRVSAMSTTSDSPTWL